MSLLNLIDPSTARDTHWDVIVIGSGIGGGSAAWGLTRRGLKVLVIEKGRATGTHSMRISSEPETGDERLLHGRWPEKLRVSVDGKTSDIWAPLGCGIGGSSRLYAAALNRLDPSDFAERNHPNGSTVCWPVRYEDLEPYYERAETLYSVAGTADPIGKQSPHPLREPHEMADVDKHFYENFKKNKLHPFRLHVGIRNVSGCRGCGGHICEKSCKQDAVNSCLEPANETSLLSVLDCAEVISLDADENRVTGVNLRHDNMSCLLTADSFVIAAGAYFTPKLLLDSTSPSWPRGLGNQGDQVGRNLMFHICELIGIWPKGRHNSDGIRSSIAVRDFYHYQGERYGEFQSTGITADYGNLLYYLRSRFDRSLFRKLGLLRHALRIPAWIGSKILSDATVFACILEDYPYSENRITLDDKAASGIHVHYTIHEELEKRTRNFRKIIRKVINTNFLFPLTEEIWPNYGHPCGTCRAGVSPENSVVNGEYRIHGLQNAYITDASIMSTSGGANPSLTIAANALRAADIITSSHQQSGQDVASAD